MDASYLCPCLARTDAANSGNVCVHRKEHEDRVCIAAGSFSTMKAFPIDAREFGPL
jgi:hypothetical protein